jgi:hypothetical protein
MRLLGAALLFPVMCVSFMCFDLFLWWHPLTVAAVMLGSGVGFLVVMTPRQKKAPNVEPITSSAASVKTEPAVYLPVPEGVSVAQNRSSK